MFLLPSHHVDSTGTSSGTSSTRPGTTSSCRSGRGRSSCVKRAAPASRPRIFAEQVDRCSASRSRRILFGGFDSDSVPRWSPLPALAAHGARLPASGRYMLGERVGLALRDAPSSSTGETWATNYVLGTEVRLVGGRRDRGRIWMFRVPVLADWQEEWSRRGVVGSPHFFVGGQGLLLPHARHREKVDGHSPRPPRRQKLS